MALILYQKFVHRLEHKKVDHPKSMKNSRSLQRSEKLQKWLGDSGIDQITFLHIEALKPIYKIPHGNIENETNLSPVLNKP